MPAALSLTRSVPFRRVRGPVPVRPAGRAPAVAGLPDPPQWYRLDDLEVFAVGEQIDGDGAAKVWTPELLRAAADNVNLHARQTTGRLYSTVASLPVGDPLRPDLGIDHDTLQRHLKEIGAANAGLVEAARFDEESGKLLVTAGRIPAPVAEAVRDGKLVAVSAEIYDEPPRGISGAGPCLRRVSLLGHQLPAVKTLAPPPLPAPDYRVHSEAGRLTVPHVQDAPIRVYAEGRTVAKTAADPFRDAWIQALAEQPLTMTAEQLSALPDDTLLELASAEESAEGEGAGTPARTAATDAEITAADPTKTPEVLKAMDDASYAQLYQQLTGKPLPAAPTGGSKPAMSTYSELLRRQGVPAVDVDKIAAEITAKVTAQVKEELKAVTDPAVAAVKGEADAVRQFSERREREAVHKRIDAVVDEALKVGVFTPGDDDTTNPAVPSRRAKLKMLDHRAVAHKFSDAAGREQSMTLLDLELADLEARIAEAKKNPHRFAEHLRQDRQAAAGAVTRERQDQLLSLTPAGRAAVAARNGAGNAN